ncbi:hypothetical protein pah_c188o007 [Parachlamydia acanthamoebae str. Hall's coccus]|nr:hypothetical protein pah_c188o007 [Parachlamydia acanthamoebae str. Hall's coccus]
MEKSSTNPTFSLGCHLDTSKQIFSQKAMKKVLKAKSD